MKCIFLLALLCPFLCMCQPLSLTGKIITENDQPIAGATVTVLRPTVNSKQQTVNDSLPSSVISHPSSVPIYHISSDPSGAFSLSNLHLGDTVLFTAVGFEPQSLVFDQSYTLHPQVTVVLRRKVSALDEVQVIAYGTTTRRLSTGSISRVTAEEIRRQPVSNPIMAMQGLVPGLFITQSSGLPGANVLVQLRGLASLKQGTGPLFIVDGVPLMLNTGGLGQINAAVNNIFNTINPADIESIEILKDADATAIYGSQGANGVVLITTKKGRRGKTLADLSYTTGWGRPSRLVPLLNTKEYLAMRREAFRNDGVTPTAANAADLLVWDTTAYTNWQRELVGGTARTQNIQLSLAGGGTYTGFNLGAAYYTESTVFPAAQPYRRGTARMALNHGSTNGKFQLTVSTNYTADGKTLPVSDLVAYTFLPPNAPSLLDGTGALVWTAGIDNPFAYQKRKYSSNNTAIGASAAIQYNILQNLLLKASLGYNSTQLSEEATIPMTAQRPSATTTGTAVWATAKAQSWVAEPYFEYRLDKGAHRLVLLGGASWQERTAASSQLSGTGYTADDLLGVPAAAASLTVENSSSLYRYTALFGRATYSFNNRYIVNAGIRRDGSSRFGDDSRFATFTSLGAAWIFASENLAGKRSWLSFGKLRASWGITGNDQIGDYQYLDAWTSATAYGYAGSPAGVLPARLYNPSYQWEKVAKAETALDMGFFKNRLLLSVAAYRTRSSSQLVSYKLPVATGFASILKNLDALIENSGLEGELSARIIQTKTLAWQVGANISLQRNRLLAYPGLETSSDRLNFSIGQPLRVLFAYRYTGINPTTGIYTFEDLDRNGSFSSSDLQVVGAPMQHWFGNFSSKLSWRSLELSFLWYYVSQTGRSYLSTLTVPPGALSSQPQWVQHRWNTPGAAAEVQKFTAGTASDAYKAWNLYRSSSAVLGDASYLRLRNLQVAWELPAVWQKRLHTTAVRLYLQGQNLVTITSYRGADPENQSLTSLPPLRMVAAGIQLTF